MARCDLLAAERVQLLAKAGKLERDVWLVHLTGEAYPADCMGRARCARRSSSAG